jgi:DNA polymerase III sliding clamp (beta) subunit (PCNA family)
MVRYTRAKENANQCSINKFLIMSKMRTMPVKDLKPILTEAKKVIGRSGKQLPICDYAHIKDGWLTATNLFDFVSFGVAYKDADLTIPVAKTLKILQKLKPSDNIGIVDSDGKCSLVVNDKPLFKLDNMKTLDFPMVGANKTETKLEAGELPIEDLQLMKKLLPFASDDELRPAMCGIRMTTDDFAATTGHVLTKIKRDGSFTPFIEDEDEKRPFQSQNSKEGYAIVRREAVKFFPNREAKIYTLGYNWLIFEFNGLHIATRNIDEKYPNIDAVMPSREDGFATTLMLDRKALLEQLNLADIAANPATHQVRFEINNGTLKICAEDIDEGTEYADTLKGIIQGQDMRIGFNKLYLEQCIKLTDADKVTIELGAPNRAMTIDVDTICMPVMLTENV